MNLVLEWRNGGEDHPTKPFAFSELLARVQDVNTLVLRSLRIRMSG